MKSLYPLLTLVALAAPAAAQRTQVYEVPRDRSATGVMTYTTSRRAIIGVTVDTRPSESDTLGATVVSVTPGGPAARAGLLGGDIVTKVNGTVLADRRARSDDDETSTPGLRMIEVLSRLSPGDTATVEWKRGTERNRRTARIVTEAAAGMLSSAGPDIRIYTDEGPGRFKFNFDDGPRGVAELQGRLEA
ncbi:MAG TPA: PDZ domain-containing protein, partial [Gemmatimonadales bacterium]|nr:PDZ domain-containing protein [Gemmatimonadales bacterium]